MGVLEKLGEKRTEVLYVYVTVKNKKWIKAQAKRLKCTESLVVDTLITESREKNATRKAR